MIQKFLLMSLCGAIHPFLRCLLVGKFMQPMEVCLVFLSENFSLDPLLYQPFLFSQQISWKVCLHLLSPFPHLSLDHTDLISALIISLKHLLLGSPVGIFHLHLARHFSSIWTKFLLKYFLTLTFRILCSWFSL